LFDYNRCLFTEKEKLRKMNVICSQGHELFTEEISKVALSASDDKRTFVKTKSICICIDIIQS